MAAVSISSLCTPSTVTSTLTKLGACDGLDENYKFRNTRMVRCISSSADSTRTKISRRSAAHTLKAVATRNDNFLMHDQSDDKHSMTEAEKALRVQEATDAIQEETHRREIKLKEQALQSRLDSELKFGKLLFSQGKYESALAHFCKVYDTSKPDSLHYVEASFQKAACLAKLGREGEAQALYQTLIVHRAPFPLIKRRAAQALYRANNAAPGFVDGASDGQERVSSLDEYLYRMYMTGFGSYVPKETTPEETREEKQLMQLIPYSILIMGPLLAIWLLMSPK